MIIRKSCKSLIFFPVGIPIKRKVWRRISWPKDLLILLREKMSINNISFLIWHWNSTFALILNSKSGRSTNMISFITDFSWDWQVVVDRAKKPVKGVEPLAFCLRGKCSTNWAKQAINHYFLLSSHLCFHFFKIDILMPYCWSQHILCRNQGKSLKFDMFICFIIVKSTNEWLR